MKSKILFTSESVNKGHPDKICDQIADLVLTKCLKKDPDSRVACEVFASNRLIIIGGEITTKAYVDVVKCAWEVLLPLGYNENDFTIISNVNSQSPDINRIVDFSKNEFGAGDQGIIFGYATNECENYMPLAINIANDLVKLAEELRINGQFKWAKSDMKSQVTIDYSNQVKPAIDTIVMSIQHEKDVKIDDFKKFVENNIINEIIKKYNLNCDCKKLINAGGAFVIGGPIGDTGLTGRKIIVDTYGGYARHGGGAFSGKDYTKVDRTGAYYARYIAKNIVAAKLADRAEVQLSYCIGQTKPISVFVETFGTNKFDLNLINEAVTKFFNNSLKQIVEMFEMKTLDYTKYSTYGHFGKADAPWEKTDKINNLIKLVK